MTKNRQETTRVHDAIDFCGVAVDVLSHEDVHRRIAAAMEGDTFMRIATVNPDFVLRARRSRAFARTLAAAQLRIADGVGLSLVARLCGMRLPRYPGADLVRDMLAMAQARGWPVRVLCRADGLSRWADVKRAAKEAYPGLDIAGEDVNVRANCGEGVCRLCSACASEQPTLYLINFGVPWQEECAEALRALRARGVAVGVGGALDFLTGAVPRAPRWMCRLGLEWIYRTLVQPARIGKALRSVVVFPIVVLMYHIAQKVRTLIGGIV